jgi:tRNA (guanine-N7-)-methyltransferase
VTGADLQPGHVSPGAQPYPPSRLHGRKRGRHLRAGGQNALENELPEYAAPLAGAAAPFGLFSAAIRELWLEIGFGDGAHLAWRAAAHPDIGFIGCEVFANGVVRLLRSIKEQGLQNIRIHNGDARILLSALPDACLSRVFVLFPDPWPKLRHHKRRLMQAETASALARVMRTGAELRFVSDHAGYFADCLATFQAHPGFVLLPQTPRDWPVTRYERKALSAGRAPHYLRAARL